MEVPPVPHLPPALSPHQCVVHLPPPHTVCGMGGGRCLTRHPLETSLPPPPPAMPPGSRARARSGRLDTSAQPPSPRTPLDGFPGRKDAPPPPPPFQSWPRVAGAVGGMWTCSVGGSRHPPPVTRPASVGAPQRRHPSRTALFSGPPAPSLLGPRASAAWPICVLPSTAASTQNSPPDNPDTDLPYALFLRRGLATARLPQPPRPYPVAVAHHW